MSTTLTDRLRRRLAAAKPGALCVGFSGGPDSTALLHALSQLPEARALALRALHVDHGLHAQSPIWARRCADFCAALDVPMTIAIVQVDTTRGEGVEAAARRARYVAFATALRVGEWLVLAHHRDDQVETVLLKLLRGAGPEGLAGMRELRPFARGWLWRPLLDTPRATLATHVVAHQLATIDDPANADPRFRRNRIRHALLPALREAFPDADRALVHAARLCRAAADYLGTAAQSAVTALQRVAGTLDAAGWLELPDALRAPVLDAWLRGHGLPAPPDAARAELERQAATAADDGVPRVDWAGVEVRVWGGRLHAMPPLAQPPVDWQAPWEGSPLALPAGGGTLELWPIAGATHLFRGPGLPVATVRLRRGGERLKPAGDLHTRSLRDLFQRARIPPWTRARCPLVYIGDELVAVADLWASDRGAEWFDARAGRPRWHDHA
ncbi:MAG TPA: tRNA lysidine(34) synthetase TilS [Rhodanobacteraceae bacterium]|nr:tRNA lysidine(34) synthetase TilS [Rhodanobacteraceae bacterium]